MNLRAPWSPPRFRPGRDPRAELIPAPHPHGADPQLRLGRPPHVVVCGGGIAGMAAAVGLAERGIGVTLLEREKQLGGRVRSWPIEGMVGAGGEPVTMSRGFHAFFRQYYNLRALLRRADPQLNRLRPVPDYPLAHVDGTVDSFAGIPSQPPLNMLGFVAKSPSFTARDLTRVDIRRAMELLDVDFPATFSRYDGVSAAQVLDRLRFPQAARHLALEVFARSFFADPRDFSGGELVAMFHSYFLGSAEGLLFDVPTGDYDATLWAPLGAYLWRCGATVRTEVTIHSLEASPTSDPDGGQVRVRGTGPDGDVEFTADAVVLAVDRQPLQRLVAESAWLGQEPWRGSLADLPMAPRFAVQRLWYDRPLDPATPPFVGTAAFGLLDNISAVHLFEEEAAGWAAHHDGSVVELHAYAIPDDVTDDAVYADLQAQLVRLHPELAGLTPVHEERLTMADCPLAGTDPWANRPGVATGDPRVVLAGDGIRCELPVALMERAATTGLQAANQLLAGWGLPGHDLWSTPTSARHPRAVAALTGLLGAGPAGRR